MSKEINVLISECKKGNRKAQLQVYNLYCEAMFYITCRYLKNEEEAKDAMQEGFINAFSNIYSYQKGTSFGAWLKRIVINKCIDLLKKKKVETISLEQHPLEVVDNEDWSFDLEVTKEMVFHAIEQLPEKYQLVVNLYLIEGYDHVEISEILSIPIKTSRTQLRRGKLLLKDYLNRRKDEARS